MLSAQSEQNLQSEFGLSLVVTEPQTSFNTRSDTRGFSGDAWMRTSEYLLLLHCISAPKLILPVCDAVSAGSGSFVSSSHARISGDICEPQTLLSGCRGLVHLLCGVHLRGVRGAGCQLPADRSNQHKKGLVSKDRMEFPDVTP